MCNLKMLGVAGRLSPVICKGAVYFTAFVNTVLGLFLVSFFFSLVKIQLFLVFAIYYS